MQFWGVEVKAGIPLEVELEDGKIVHISQGSLGEGKEKETEPVCIYLNTSGQKVAIGTLSRNIPQISHDLYLERKFELSHTWKEGSVYFCGYKFALEQPDSPSDDSDSEEDLSFPGPQKVKPLKQEKALAQNAKTENSDSGAPKPTVQNVKPVKDVKFHVSDVVSASSEDDSSSDESSSDEDEPKVQIVKPIKDVKVHGSDVVSASSEDDSSSDESSSDESSSDEDEMQVVNDKADEEDEDGDEDDSDEEDESDDQTEKMAAPSKKRANDSATRTPVPEKKAKFRTPEKIDVKKGSGPSGHVATPHPSKQTGKTPVNNDKSKEQTPKAVKSGEFSCGSCNRSFGSDMALQSHTKAKHPVS